MRTCQRCGLTNPDTTLRCDCGYDFRSGQTGQQLKPALWNPNAVANWSLPLTPVFGSTLNYLNWKALGQQDRAHNSLIWIRVSIGVLTLLAAFSALESGGAEKVLALLYLIVWYFAAGRKQARYVRDTYGQNYTKRPWGKPLGLAVLGLLGLLLAAVVIGAVIGVIQGVTAR